MTARPGSPSVSMSSYGSRERNWDTSRRVSSTDVMSESEDKKAGLGSAVAVVAAVLAIYVLSVGPAERVVSSCPPPMQRLLRGIYAPLMWLNARLPGYPLFRYLDLWKRSASTTSSVMHGNAVVAATRVRIPKM